MNVLGNVPKHEFEDVARTRAVDLMIDGGLMVEACCAWALSFKYVREPRQGS